MVERSAIGEWMAGTSRKRGNGFLIDIIPDRRIDSADRRVDARRVFLWRHAILFAELGAASDRQTKTQRRAAIILGPRTGRSAGGEWRDRARDHARRGRVLRRFADYPNKCRSNTHRRRARAATRDRTTDVSDAGAGGTDFARTGGATGAALRPETFRAIVDRAARAFHV